MPLPHDGGRDAAPAGDAGDGGDAGCAPRWQPLPTCGAGCPDASTVRLGLAAVGSARSEEAPLLESVDFVPGTDDRAVAMGAEHVLAEVLYGPDGPVLDRIVTLPEDLATQYTTSVRIHPSGRFAAVSVADVDCAPGEVLFVDVGDRFGEVVARVEVGFSPDNVAFSPDGRFLVTADEDERSNRPCKPDDRHGGTISVVSVSDDPTTAAVAQTIPVDHAVDSEPESVGIGADGTVAVTIQETSELAVFRLSDVPSATARILPLPAGGDPDGVAVDAARGIAVVGLEHVDDVLVVDLESGAILDRVDLVASGDVPDDYNRDTGGGNEVHEPEQTVTVESEGALFALFPLQESHALLAYRVADDGSLVFDSVAPTGVEWMRELGGRTRSLIGPEGLAARPDVGLFLVANEREGSVTLLKAAASMYAGCR